MPRRSTKRYPPEQVDLAGEVDLTDLAQALRPFANYWTEGPSKERKRLAEKALESTCKLLAHTAPGSPPRAVEQRVPGCTMVEPALRHHVMPAYQNHAPYDVIPAFPEPRRADAPQDDGPPPIVFAGAGVSDPREGTYHVRNLITLRLLEQQYRHIVANPDQPPTAAETAHQLVALASAELNRERRAAWDIRKKETLKALGLAIARSLTDWSPDQTVVNSLYHRIAYHVEDIAGPDEYGPRSHTVLGELVKLVAQWLEEIGRRGIGGYDFDTLRNIFTPRELAVLCGCVEHWRDPEEWSWSEVLKHLGLDRAFDERALRRTCASVKKRLEDFPDLVRALDLQGELPQGI